MAILDKSLYNFKDFKRCYMAKIKKVRLLDILSLPKTIKRKKERKKGSSGKSVIIQYPSPPTSLILPPLLLRC